MPRRGTASVALPFVRVSNVGFAQLEAIALREPWARGLIYCDIEGFAVQSDGSLILLDECGNHVYPPPEVFRVEWFR